MTSKARVKEILLDKYIVELLDEKKDVIATIRGKAKKNNSILVGDIVQVENIYNEYVIVNILDRKNSLIRPPVANIDNLLIVLSLENPKPDFLLLDKQIILCMSKNIKPVVVLNKMDLNLNNKTSETLKYIDDVYVKMLGMKLYKVSAKIGLGLDELKLELANSLSAFSGNSGVGKSSLVKSIFPNCNFKENDIGEVAKKTNRGKHTTKHIRIYKEDNICIVDTPGFSSFDVYDIVYKDLKKYYTEFLQYDCDYADCNHANEDISVCKVKQAINEKNIDLGRYNRYLELYNKLKKEDERKYK